MKLALLGCDDVTLAVARSAAAGGEHSIACLCEVGAATPLFDTIAPLAQRLDHWEGLLAGAGVDAIVVARGADEDLRAEQLRKLAQAAVPLLLSHPAHTSVLLCYELDMIRRETGAVLLPFLPGHWHPAAARLVELARSAMEGGIGPWSQLVFERALAEPTKSEATTCFARDIDLVRIVCGELTKVSSLAPPATANYANLGVQLSGPGGALVRWSVEPAHAAPGARLTLWGSSGKAVLLMPDAGADAAPWRLDVTVHDRQASGSYLPFDAPAAALAHLARAITGERVQPDWIECIHSVELAEAVERSLAKGRTVELRTDEQSEDSAFKGIMASAGCGLLVVALISIVPAAIAAQLGVRWAGYWPYALCAIFALFLLLQLFKLVVPARRGEAADPAERPS